MLARLNLEPVSEPHFFLRAFGVKWARGLTRVYLVRFKFIQPDEFGLWGREIWRLAVSGTQKSRAQAAKTHQKQFTGKFILPSSSYLWGQINYKYLHFNTAIKQMAWSRKLMLNGAFIIRSRPAALGKVYRSRLCFFFCWAFLNMCF